MKEIVDADMCIGCGLCAKVAPDVYEMKGDKAVALLDEIPADMAEEASNGAEQ